MTRKFMILILSLLMAGTSWSQIIMNEVESYSFPYMMTRILSDMDESILTDFNQASQINSIASADLDGDGKIDLLKSKISSYPYGFYLTLSTKGESFIKTSIPVYARGVFVEDVNKDNIKDLVYSSKNQLIVKLGKGNGDFEEAIKSGIGSSMMEQILAIDINNDNNLDLVTIVNSHNHEVSKSQIFLQYGNGKGYFKPAQKVVVDTNISSATLVGSKQLAVGGSRGRHAGESGVFTFDFINSQLANLKKIYQFSPNALCADNENEVLYGITSNEIFSLNNGTLLTQELTQSEVGLRRADISFLSGSISKEKRLAILETSGQSKIRIYRLY